ncbi:MAG TPA: protoporphyrinogen oxidase [Rhabdochlamydiaceae bacterium]|jgi:oxygen-dependent protoporphyrinogen oxidase
MRKKHIIVLGSGISGLSAAWNLSQSQHPVDITVVEKSNRAGGLLHTEYMSDFHFEKGPRAFKVNKCPALLELVCALGMANELLWTPLKRHPRYLWHNGELHRFPSHPLSFCFSPLTRGFISALFSEWRKPSKEGDETVWEFVMRRFNHDVARLFFDPLVVGIFGGDIREISVRACFPKLKSWEEKYGCVTKGFFYDWNATRKAPKFACSVPGLPNEAIFSFKKGIEQLPHALMAKIPADFHFQQDVQRIAMKENKVEVATQDRIFYADALFCALPIKETSQLFEHLVPEIAREFLKVPSEGIAVLNMGYDGLVLPFSGYGYLVPTHAQEEILGAVFDSSIFPQHNHRPLETRLTIKMEERGRDDAWYVDAALRALRRHLGISQMPTALSFKRAQRAIPQYGVSHLDKMANLRAEFSKRLPRCFLAGNYLSGVTVDQCIARAKEAVSEWENSPSIL